jgi:hypothetical protein
VTCDLKHRPERDLLRNRRYHLVAQVELFVGLVQSEIGYSSYGRRVTQEAQQLFAVTRQYNQVLQSNTLTGQQLKIAADNTERSLQQLEADFYRVPGASPQSQRVLQQISQLVAAAQSAVPGGGTAANRSEPSSGQLWVHPSCRAAKHGAAIRLWTAGVSAASRFVSRHG